jgi:hypothetical protein
MRLDKAVRNTLRSVVTQSRKLLEEAISELLQGQYGIHASGEIEDATAMAHLSEEEQQHREQLLIQLGHIKAAGFKPEDAVAQLIREIAYTHLNRLCAYKMMETRRLIRESVSRGVKSNGFMFYLAKRPEDEQLYFSGQQERAYQHFLLWLGGTLSEEIGVLFSPRDPASKLFPPYRVLEQVLALLNKEELKNIWGEDETIGWVYQYFTPKELRDQAHEESRAPRNSYELAFRNQFYTPRYVVQFLTDNTLGRIWYEMRQGQTRLAEQCAYMVRRPDEVFLDQPRSPEVAEAQRWLHGEDVPEPDLWPLAHTVNAYKRVGGFEEGGNAWVEERLPRLTQEGATALKTQELLDLLFLFCRKERFCEGTIESLSNEISTIKGVLSERVRPANKENRSQEELLRAPFFIPYRSKKDPREIKILDPACGSGHFLLYCFDLLETIYEEAYADPDLCSPLRERYPTLADLKRDVPGLILTNNLHGIDIDLRATQIATLALWLRAQRAYQEQGLSGAERLKITRSNIVCAEPMPGEKDILEEFIRSLQPVMLGDMVRTIFEKMQLAGETGSLLKIENEIKEAVLEARQYWLLRPQNEQLALWPEQSQIEKQKLLKESRVTGKEFWDGAEARVIKALEQYAYSVSNGKALARQLFAGDAVQGFAFIDICQKRFDVVLMNPPFGEASKASKTYIDRTYPQTKGDVLANFVERALVWLLSDGLVGAISSRTCFFLGTYTSFREEVLREKGYAFCMADLGEGVLEAMVETAAYILRKMGNQQEAAIFFRELLSSDKPVTLLQSIQEVGTGYLNNYTFLIHTNEFSQLPGSPYAYWVESSTIQTLTKEPRLEGNAGIVRVGLQTGNDTRFLRLIWEVSPSKIGSTPSDCLHSETFIERLRSSFRGEKRWAFFSKTDIASPWVSPLTLVVDWEQDGDVLKELLQSRDKDGPSIVIRSESFYFQAGFSYMNRSIRLVPYIVPAGTIPTAGRSQVYPAKGKELALLAYCASNIASAIARFSGGKFVWPKFQASMVQNLQVPTFTLDTVRNLTERITAATNARRSVIQGYEPYQEFTYPALFTSPHGSSTTWNPLTLLGQQLDQEVAKAFGLSEVQLNELERDIREAVAVRGKMILETENGESDEDTFNVALVDESTYSKQEGFISYCVGCAFGRWDVRMALNTELAPRLQGIFDPLPACPPGMLIAPVGLPAASGSLVSEEWLRARPDAITFPKKCEVKRLTIPDSEYPIAINWEGILVDDPDHGEDIVRRVRDVLQVIWQERAEAIEQEACQILGVKELREYFRKSGNGGFWMDHVRRYSKSRRKAPIYWLLQSSKRNYALWLYYHRLDKDVLFKALTKYVEPKIRLEEGRLEQVKAQIAGTGSGGREFKQLEKQRDHLDSLLMELYDFRDKLQRAANLNLEPDLNDGVVLNIAPLRELVPWGEAKKYWQELRDGKYEWSSIGKQLRAKGFI